MLRALLLSLLMVPSLALCQVTWNKDMPPTHPAIPEPKSFNWDLDGTHAVEFTWEYGPETGMDGYILDSCSNRCLGKKHFLHEHCDASCDRACTDIHRDTLSAAFLLTHSEFLDSPDRFDKVFIRETGKVGVGPKYPHDQVAWGMIEQIRKPIEDAKNLTVTVNWTHFAKSPCSVTTRAHVGYERSVTLIWEVYRYETTPDGRQVKVGGGKHRTDLGTVIIPQDGVAEEVTTNNCQCSIVHDAPPPEEEKHQVIPELPVIPVEEKKTGAVIRQSASGTAVCDSQALDKFQFNVVCENMNECMVSCTNPTNEKQKFTLLPGLVMMALTAGYQDMLLTDPIIFEVEPAETASIRVPIAHPGPMLYGIPWAGGKGQILCMNMTLKEPNPKVPYRIAGPASPGLRRLAQLTYGTNIRSSIEQVRLWIATDGASMAKMGEILIPSPRPGQYADALYDAFLYGGLSNEDPKFKECFDPSVVAGAAKPRTTPWLIKELVRRDASGLAKWVSGNTAAFAPLFTANGARLGVPHASRLATALCQASDAKVRMTGLDFLTKGVPEASRAEVAKAGGLSGVSWCLMNGAAEEVTAALAVCEIYKSPVVGFGLRNLSKNATAEAKAKASELVKSF